MSHSEHVLRSKIEVLADLEGAVERLIKAHEAKRTLWFPSQLLGPAPGEDPERHVRGLRARARGIGQPARLAIALNQLTEEGLPHFHRLLAHYLDANGFWAKWNFLWTAEEDRHGAVLHDYARDAALFDTLAMERMQFEYLRRGFEPAWENDPYRVFVYTTLQERATQASHANVGKMCAPTEPTIAEVLKQVAMEEARHFSFYRTVVSEIITRDPNRALHSASLIMPAIEMPGASMPHFQELADVVRRVGIYGLRDYVAIVREQIRFWKVDLLTGLDAVGRRAQEKIMGIPVRLERLADAMESRTRRRTFSFPLTFSQEFALDQQG